MANFSGGNITLKPGGYPITCNMSGNISVSGNGGSRTISCRVNINIPNLASSGGNIRIVTNKGTFGYYGANFPNNSLRYLDFSESFTDFDSGNVHITRVDFYFNSDGGAVYSWGVNERVYYDAVRPSKGTVSIQSLGAESVTIYFNGFTPQGSATITKYQISTNDSTWSDIGSSTTYTINGLTEITKYTIYIRCVDSNGIASESVPITFTTLEGQLKAYVVFNKNAEKYRFYNVNNNSIFKIKDGYVVQSRKLEPLSKLN